MGGNVGGQSATIVVRGFATGKINFTTMRQVFFKELRVGLIMGSVCGVVIGLVAYGWHHNPYLGLVVGTSLFGAALVIVANLVVDIVQGLIDPRIRRG